MVFFFIHATYLVCTATAMQGWRDKVNKQRLFLGHSLVNTFPWQWMCMQQQKNFVFYVVHAEKLQPGQLEQWVSWVLHGRLRRDGTIIKQNEFNWQLSCSVLTNGKRCDHKSWRISTIKIYYQETSSESRLTRLLEYTLVICKVCRSAIALLSVWSSELCV
jgi:hypothetical protein